MSTNNLFTRRTRINRKGRHHQQQEDTTPRRTSKQQDIPAMAEVRRGIKRNRRTRLFVLITLLGLIGFLLFGLKSSSDESNFTESENGKLSYGYLDALFDYGPFKKHFNSVSEKEKKLNKNLKVKEDAILKKYRNDADNLLNDADQLKNLYLSYDHNGIVNLGTTGNMANPELNNLLLINPKKELENLIKQHRQDVEENPNEMDERYLKLKESIQKMSKIKSSSNDRSVPLSESIIPDEDAFSGIDPEQFSKGDITFQTFFSHIFKLLSVNHLSFPLQRRMALKDGKPIIDNVLCFSESQVRLSEFDLLGFFDFPTNFVDDLKVKHENVVNGIPDIEPKFYKGNGYVVVGGGIYSWYALLGIETLRKVGSKFPVEVFLPDPNDYEYEFCEKILPKLNAKCIEMYRVFGHESLENFDVQGYQYKAFALLASSFENAFLLDSDAYPVTNPDVLFESDLYKEYQMITWPDFWRRTTSPIFYEIRRSEIGMVPVRNLNDYFVNPKFLDYRRDEDISVSIPFHNRAGTIPDWTTESGEMLINKKLHFKSLILALYYNYDGPYGYYPLLSQGGAGEGDKETFVAAANYYGLKNYQSYKLPEKAYGWFNHEENYEHSTIVQYNPLLDYKMLQDVHEKLRQDMESQGEDFKYDYDKYFTEFFTADVCEPMFYHVHDPKMNPFKIMDEKWTENLNNQKIRNMGEDFPRVNFDLELFIWGVIRFYICDIKFEVRAFAGKDLNSLCNDFLTSQMEYLEKSSTQIFEAYAAGNVETQLKGGRIWN